MRHIFCYHHSRCLVHRINFLHRLRSTPLDKTACGFIGQPLPIKFFACSPYQHLQRVVRPSASSNFFIKRNYFFQETLFIFGVYQFFQPIKIMIGVNVKDNESIDRAINRFKKMVTRSRVLNEYKERQQFTKPSEERREAMKKSVREERRRQRDNY